MSSVPSSADSCPALRSCLYMSRISSLCFCNRRRRAWYWSRGTSTVALAFSVLATLRLLSTGRSKKAPYDTAFGLQGLGLRGLAMIAHSSLNRERAVELLVQHDPCQFVGERHGAQGEHRAG